ncbi:MAG: PilW family protein [Janthinobacterium lividum]
MKHLPTLRLARIRGGSAHGFTLVELMVALALTLLLVVVAAACLQVARRGQASVDALSQLQDNARFAADMAQRIAGQAGYLDADNAVETDTGNFMLAAANSAPPFVEGYDDAIVPAGAAGAVTAVGANGSRSVGCTASAGSACNNGSDILVLRSQANARWPGSTKTDGTMLDCMGDSIDVVPADRTETSVSVLHLRVGNDGEPSLMCSVGTTKGTVTTLVGKTQPVVQGVENFQVLYGVDGVLPNTRPTGPGDAVAERYLRASQMVVPGDPEGTRLNWERVRALRIGMVLRGPPDSAQDRSASITFFPLGEAMSATQDAGSRFVPTLDGRLRQTLTFTVHLHNRQQP